MKERETFSLWDKEARKVIKVEAEKVGKTDEWKAKCPKHSDKVASLCINKEKEVYYCQGCKFKGQLYLPDLKTIKRRPRRGPPLATYTYYNEKGKLLYQVLKYKYGENKFYPQRQPDGEGGWIDNIEGVRRVLYKLPELLKSKDSTVFMVEGEKDTDNLIELGLTATTSPMGALKWNSKYNGSLKGFKTIILIPDNNQPGKLHMRQVANSLLENNFKDIRVLNLPKLEDDEDVSDWLKKDNCNKEVLLMLAEEAPTFTPFVLKLEKVLAAFKKWLVLQETDYIEVVLATVVSLSIPEDPVWIFLTGRSGGTKTEVLRSMTESPLIYALSEFTAHTLISGMRIGKGADPSLLPLLDGKVLAIKDFSCILSKPADEKTAIFSQLRDSYDGYASKKFGTEQREKGYRVHYGVIAGITGAIDQVTAVEQTLGERFLKIRLSKVEAEEDKKVTMRALRNVTELTLMREELSKITTDFLSQPFNPSVVEIGPEIQNKLADLALLIGKCRTSVSREPFERSIIQYPPDPESGARIVIQFAKLVKSLAVIRGKSEVTEAEFKIIKRVARDTLPTKRMLMLKILYEAGATLPTPDIGKLSRLGNTTALRTMHNFEALEIAEGELRPDTFIGKDGKEHTHRVLWWTLTDKLRQSLDTITLWQDDETSLKARMKKAEK